MKIVHWFLGMTAILSVIVILLISSFEIGIYSDFGWYEKEYEKYNVTEDLEMKMDDVMDVTEEMMASQGKEHTVYVIKRSGKTGQSLIST